MGDEAAAAPTLAATEAALVAAAERVETCAQRKSYGLCPSPAYGGQGPGSCRATLERNEEDATEAYGAAYAAHIETFAMTVGPTIAVCMRSLDEGDSAALRNANVAGGSLRRADPARPVLRNANVAGGSLREDLAILAHALDVSYVVPGAWLPKRRERIETRMAEIAALAGATPSFEDSVQAVALVTNVVMRAMGFEREGGGEDEGEDEAQ